MVSYFDDNELCVFSTSDWATVIGQALVHYVAVGSLTQIMNQLQLFFLGPFTVVHNRTTVTDFESNKVRALLVYLAVEQGEHTRTALAALLWPDYDERNARTNLRQVLYQLRRVLGDEQAQPPTLLISRHAISFNPAADCFVDVTTLRALLAQVAAHDHPTLASCEPCLERLRQAVDLYRNDFLIGFALDDSAAFEEWRRITQEQLHLQILDALTQLGDAAEAAGEDAKEGVEAAAEKAKEGVNEAAEKVKEATDK
ncbi:MAG: hypothetical protein KDA44_14535 [Planctomycetales bacterium]|nr:hypothetical protein [Planctomycetales bacterium]